MSDTKAAVSVAAVIRFVDVRLLLFSLLLLLLLLIELALVLQRTLLIAVVAVDCGVRPIVAEVDTAATSMTMGEVVGEAEANAMKSIVLNVADTVSSCRYTNVSFATERREAHSSSSSSSPLWSNDGICWVSATQQQRNTTRHRIRALIMGAPGSGKGTISEWIVRDFNLKYLAAGDLLRKNIKDNTPLGLDVSKYLDRGQLVPDELVTKLILEELTTTFKGESYLLDGFPRTIPQAEALHEKEKLETCINLAVPEQEIMDRIQGRWYHPGSGRTYHTQFQPPKVAGKDDVTGEPLEQRPDDKPETVKARLETYRNQTAPVLNFYKSKNILQEFAGTKSKEIYPNVYKFLATLRKPVNEE